MKTTVCLIIAITLATICLSDAQSADGGTNGCRTDCNTDSEWKTQICATNDEGKTKIFPSECVMKTENCLNKTKYVKTSEAEGGSCP